jgi:TolA-binding protein
MAFENFPTAEQAPVAAPVPPKQDWRNYLTAALVIALLGTWGYIIWLKNNSKETIQQKDTVIATTTSQKDELQKELEETNKEKLTEARLMIADLNGDIESFKTKIETLEGEKIVLTKEKETVTKQRDQVRKDFDSSQLVIKQKDEVIDIGSTLHATNFSILGINDKGNGNEKQTSTAKRVDKLRISFDLDENRITQSGVKNIFVCIIAPDATEISSIDNARFSTRDGKEKPYTQKLDVNYVQWQRQTINFDWRQTGGFKPGDYKIEIYNNGFKIGEGIRSLKKGGIFS